jgi:hypothetical protein
MCLLSIICLSLHIPCISRDSRLSSFCRETRVLHGSDVWYFIFYGQSHPRFIVFPAPRGLASVNIAHSSSFSLFSSDLASPNAVPSCSASMVSCSEDVGFAADCGLRCVSQVRAQEMRASYPPPVRMLPRCRSISRYSSIVIVGRR